MTPNTTIPCAKELGFTSAWFASGVITAESVADFVRIAASHPPRPSHSWRWAAFRDFVEERGALSPTECRAAYVLGTGEVDAGLGTAIMCAVLYQRSCPAELLREAVTSDRAAVRRTAAIRMGSGQ
jgi:hypothetical protein